ncbi:hypothetical protein B0H67DRAFT_307833 [Lasiosphaeris hirsuta]|uniref:Uncharacterized protein n=1 Tax=Lasiosphaeris hirsuta TaxID=260670 RepID=A0AA40DN51_9PEZI|nr:hypothetical protein B0H67DRAFT_307833 [Lasiosphaeris hirsuta]
MSLPEARIRTGPVAPQLPAPKPNDPQPRDPESARRKPPPESRVAKGWRWTQYGIRCLFAATAGAVLGVTGYIAAEWGTTHDKVYAVAIIGAAMAFLGDALAVVFLANNLPRAAQLVSVPDAIAIALCGIGIPTILSSSLQNELDPIAWKLVAAVIAERVASIAICLSSCFFMRRKVTVEHKPYILDQRLSLMSMKNSPIDSSTVFPFSRRSTPPSSTATSMMMPASLVYPPGTTYTPARSTRLSR